MIEALVRKAGFAPFVFPMPSRPAATARPPGGAEPHVTLLSCGLQEGNISHGERERRGMLHESVMGRKLNGDAAAESTGAGGLLAWRRRAIARNR